MSPEEVRVRNLRALQCRGVGDYVSDEGQLLQPLHGEPPTVFADYVRLHYEAAYASASDPTSKCLSVMTTQFALLGCD